MTMMCRLVSRDRDNPTAYRGRTNGNLAQRLEPIGGYACNITSVAKDNLVMEIYDMKGNQTK